MKEKKIYSKQTLTGWLHWFFDIEDKHITMRLAGKPALLLEKAQEMYWDKEGTQKFKEFLSLLDLIGQDGKSPFVFYINDKKEQWLLKTDTIIKTPVYDELESINDEAKTLMKKVVKETKKRKTTSFEWSNESVDSK